MFRNKSFCFKEKIDASKKAVCDLFVKNNLTYGEAKRVLWQLINEFKRKEEKYLDGSSIQALESTEVE